MMSTDVTLPIGQSPEFPDKCVSCEEPRPKQQLKFSSRQIGLHSLLLFWKFGKKQVVEVPICGNCSRQVKWRRGSTAVMYYLLVISAIFYFGFKFEVRELPLGKPILMGIGVIAMIPIIYFEIVHPPVFDITVFKKKIDYEFRSKDYAHEFAALNETDDV